MRVGIIGAGISGVSLGSKLALLKKFGAELDITLLESSNRVGGTIETANSDGYLTEAATNGFLDSKPFTLDTFREAGLAFKLVRSNDSARKRYIQKNAKLLRLPENATSFFSSPLISWKGKMRIAGELFIAQKKDGKDETLADFVRRRLGKEVLDYLVGPMVSGVFAGNPEKMCVASSFPAISNLEKEYGGLIKALLFKKNKKAGPGGPTGVLTTYEGGMGAAVKDLADKAQENGLKIVLKSPVTKVTKNKGQFNVEASDKKYVFDRVAICSPAYSAGEFLQPLNSELADILASIPYAPMFIAGLGFNNEDMKDPIDGFGYLIPHEEKRDILGALFTSSMFPSQAPKGKKFLRVMAGGDVRKDLIKKSDKELLELCLRDVKDVLGIVKDPYYVKCFRYDKAIPQYYVGHQDKAARVEKLSKEIGGLYIGGNLLYGIGVNDCTKQSKLIAETIKADLTSFKDHVEIVTAKKEEPTKTVKTETKKAPAKTAAKKTTTKLAKLAVKKAAAKKPLVKKAEVKKAVKTTAKPAEKKPVAKKVVVKKVAVTKTAPKTAVKKAAVKK